MSWVRIYVHVVFSTKNQVPFLNTPQIRKQMFQHIYENARDKNIWLEAVNGYDDHAHCLISMGSEQCISKLVQLIKGESSFWINKEKIIEQKFSWQDDYWALGIAGNHVDNVRNYIFRQEEHHSRVKSFDVEIEELFGSVG